jgi:hypothetical protein
VKQTKKSRVNKTGKNDMIEKLIKDMSKLVLIATQAVTEKITIAIRQILIYAVSDSAPFFKQTDK